MRRASFLLVVIFYAAVAPRDAVAVPGRVSGAPLVYVRSGPGPDHQPVRILSEGDSVEKLEDLGSWTKIRTPQGEEGYVYSSFVTETAAATGTPTTDSPPAAPAGAEDVEAAGVPATGGGEPTTLTEQQQLAAEVSGLRLEIAELRNRLLERLDRPPENTAPQRTAEPVSPAGRTRLAEPSLPMLATALVSLVIGLVFGVAFSRRRSRSQRSRLKF